MKKFILYGLCICCLSIPVVYVFMENKYKNFEDILFPRKIDSVKFHNFIDESKVDISVYHRWNSLKNFYHFEKESNGYVLKENITLEEKQSITSFLYSIGYFKWPVRIFHLLMILQIIILIKICRIIYYKYHVFYYDIILLLIFFITIIMVWFWGYVWFSGELIV